MYFNIDVYPLGTVWTNQKREEELAQTQTSKQKNNNSNNINYYKAILCKICGNVTCYVLLVNSSVLYL